MPLPTLAAPPAEEYSREVTLPANTLWIAYFMGALRVLCEPSYYRQAEGGLTPEEMAERMEQILSTMYGD